ncbi:MAG TPA: phosphodiester glycosidase family protein, partial [Caldithrix abyssi]|nr:phosphodiester glycosidase family protein [Caldithrix abyssi]
MFSMKTIIFLVLFACTLWARYEVLVDKSINVAPGIVYKHLRVFEKFWNINFLEIDLKNPYVKIETVKAENSLTGTETVSSMARKRSFAGHQVVAAINADFFDIDGVPNNVQVVQGQILQNPTNVSTLGFDAENHPWLGMVSFNGEIITKNGNHSIQGINKIREPDEIVLYNSYYGSSTKTDRWGSEAAIHPITPWIVNDTVWAVVTAKQSFKGDMAIPENGAVLSAQGEAMIFLDNNAVIGDTIALVLNLTPALPKLVEMVGGFPKIVYQGKNWAAKGYQEEGGPVHAFQVHPRTAIGFNADSSKFYFFTVDGRKPGVFRGMTLPELADVMIDFGVAYGVNLDGGGSTTFVLSTEVKNFPTEGEERPVAAALLAVSTAPNYSLETIQLIPDSLELYFTQKVKLNFHGWDQNFNPLQFKENDFYFETSEGLGEINESGWFKANTNGAQGYVYLHYKNIVDSTFIRVIGLKKIKLEPEFSVTDTLQPISLSVTGIAENGKEIFLADSLVRWVVSNPKVGAVVGSEFIGLNEGTIQLVASLNSMRDTITVQVKA